MHFLEGSTEYSELPFASAANPSVPVGVVSLEDLLARVRPPVEAAVRRPVGRAAEADAAVPARRVEVAAVGRITVAPLKGAITDSVLTRRPPPLLLLLGRDSIGKFRLEF